MKNILFVTLLLSTFGAIAQDAAPKRPVLNISADKFDNDKPFNHRKSHWVTNFGFSSTKYKLPLSYSGSKITFKEEERELHGGGFGVGYEAYMGWGFLLGGRVEGFFMGTAFQNEKEAENVGGLKVGSERDAGQMYGGNAIGHFGWMFDYKTKNPFLGEMTYMAMELFAEAGVGRATAYGKKSYYYKAGVNDAYNFRMTDTMTTGIVSAGVNFLSRSSGYFLNLKASRMFLDVDKRKISGRSTSGGVSSDLEQTIENPDIDPVYVFALGGGYKF